MQALILGIVFLVLGGLSLALHYYITLFMTKDEFTKDEFKNLTPYFKGVAAVATQNFQISWLLLILVFSGLLGVVLPVFFVNSFFNSIFPFLLVYFAFPFLARFLAERQVTDSDSPSDYAANIFIKYHSVFSFGFGLGVLTGFSYNWVHQLTTGFLFFAFNFAAAIVLLQFALTIVLQEK